ncbi:tRNA(Ile)-lysidine synthetase-like protein [Clostridium beijerinckii]|nr:tRNA(Ile)-lysidine synthetase-like protein [Clostridium beijerinckii]
MEIYIKTKTKKSDINSKKEEIILGKDNIYINTVEFHKYVIQFSIINGYNENSINLKQGDFVKYFDFDKINNNISIRNRKNGDKIIPLGMSGSKKLKDIFIDMKIPKNERECIPILCFDERIAWVIGIRISEEYKLTSKSTNILKVVVQRKEY